MAASALAVLLTHIMIRKETIYVAAGLFAFRYRPYVWVCAISAPVIFTLGYGHKILMLITQIWSPSKEEQRKVAEDLGYKSEIVNDRDIKFSGFAQTMASKKLQVTATANG